MRSSRATHSALCTATRGTGELQRDTRTVSLRLDKIEGEWRIVAISVSAPGESATP